MSIDTKKFLELVKPHYNNALKYCRALCAGWSPDNAEDVLQDSFLKAMENLHRLNDESKFRSWFFTIITREFYSSVRKHFWKKFIPMDKHPDIPEMPDVYNRHEQNEVRMLLNKALAKLSAKERAALLLFEIGEFSIEEIREVQNEKSISAVKSRLSRSREKLRKHITGMESNKRQNFIIETETPEGDITNETIGLISEAKEHSRQRY